jgi:hypothetical protein
MLLQQFLLFIHSFICYMFRLYDHLQEEYIYIYIYIYIYMSEITLLTSVVLFCVVTDVKVNSMLWINCIFPLSLTPGIIFIKTTRFNEHSFYLLHHSIQFALNVVYKLIEIPKSPVSLIMWAVNNVVMRLFPQHPHCWGLQCCYYSAINYKAMPWFRFLVTSFPLL